jgi:pre-mRNA-splicing factor SYF2
MTLKRKPSPSQEDNQGEPSKRRFTETDGGNNNNNNKNDDIAQDGSVEKSASAVAATTMSTSDTPRPDASTSTSTSTADRLARFAALRNRNKSSRDDNRKATAFEISRVAADPALVNSLSRKKDRAQEKLLEAQTEEAGEDYERKRAWDWTAEECEKWDKKQAKRAFNRNHTAFQDFSQEANKTYLRQVREMIPDTKGYERDKLAAIERAAASGGLEIVETDEGELIAVDKDGSFYSTKDSTDFVGNRPSKEAIDKLVGEIRKAEEVRMKQRKNRGKGEDDGDVTYINDKNKQVSLKRHETRLTMFADMSHDSLTKSWRGFTTSTLRRFGTVLREVLLYEGEKEMLYEGVVHCLIQNQCNRLQCRNKVVKGGRFSILVYLVLTIHDFVQMVIILG